MKSPMHIRGMFGLGDNIHQRAALRILKETHDITLETMWASLYHDLVGDDFRLVRRTAALRTQLKNAERERHLFSPAPPFGSMAGLRFSYNPSTIEHTTASKTVLEAMFAGVGLKARYPEADYRLPVPQGWLDGIDQHIGEWNTGGKPIMVYRPLTERPEYVGSSIRNADPAAYSEMASLLRERFFIVSVADLEPGKEWIVGPPFPADVCYHKGEFYFELLAALFKRADLVFTSGGFAAMLGSAVETPVISIKGLYEPVSWHADCGKFSPYLAIPTIVECRCGTSGCRNHCSKAIDIPKARAAVNVFVDGLSNSVNTKAPIMLTQRLDLPNVTLVCVETQAHDLVRIAIEDATEKAKFSEVILYTDKPDKFAGLENVVMYEVPNWPNKTAMGHFYYSEAARTINTSHALLMEWDAGIRDVSMWDPAFLDYDYIGAPWPGQPYNTWSPNDRMTVGNGGFCLVSKRLIEYIAAQGIKCTSDMDIARNYRGAFEKGFGAKWAPEDVAYRFAFECGPPEQAVKPSFGYHDVFNWHLALPNDETIRRTRVMMQSDYIVTKTPKMNLLGRSAPWIKTAIPEFAAAEARNPTRPITAKHLSGRERIQMLQPGIGVVTTPPRDGNETRRAYERELQRRGLKA